MSDERKEARVNVEDLPQAEQELTPEEAKDVKGGIFDDPFFFDVNVVSSPKQGDGSVRPTPKITPES